jgi:hypothetical protein
MVGHRKIVTPSRVLMDIPARVRLTEVETGLADGNPIQVVVPPFESLGQDIPRVRTKHAKQMGLGHVLDLMRSENPDGQNVEGVKNLFWLVSTEKANDLSARPLFIGLCVGMTILIPLSKLFNHPLHLLPKIPFFLGKTA